MKLLSTLALSGGLTLLSVGSLHAADAAALKDGLYAEIDTTKGKILVQLEFEKVPLTVANFVGLAEGTKDSNKPKGTPFYNGIVFHRVIPDFMIQTGDPEGTGRGSPGYRFADEFNAELKHTSPGILSMANSGPNSNGSQFFITVKATPWLDNRHSVFGRVIQGQEVADAISKAPRGASDRPNDELKMNTVKIVRVGDKAKAFKGDQAHFDALLKERQDKQTAELKGQAEKDKQRMEAEKQQIVGAIEGIKKQNPGKELKTTASGLQYMVLKEGAGDKPAKGANIKAHYTGKLVDGKVFDSSITRGEPIEFPVGTGRVIKGWDEALSEMKKGEKRILIIPPDLGYGGRGAGGVIPPFATLIFEVELVSF